MLVCQGVSGCTCPVTHADNKGFINCTDHGISRRSSHPCRKLLKWEIKELEAGRQIWWDSRHNQKRLEQLRTKLRAECISYGELHELQSLIPHIKPDDVELLQAAGVPEFDDEAV